MRQLSFLGVLALASGLGHAAAEQYIIKTTTSSSQTAEFRAMLNGQTVMLHRDVKGEVDVTRFVKAGKNSLTLEVKPGRNANEFSDSTFTLGAGQGSKWRTLFKYEVKKGTPAGQVKFAFIGHPSPVPKVGKVSLFGEFSNYQPVQFEVSLNGEVVSTMNSKGNFDLTPFLHKGKNAVTVKYVPGKNGNQFSQSTLTIGEQSGSRWNSVFKFAVGRNDKAPGKVTFPIYR